MIKARLLIVLVPLALTLAAFGAGFCDGR